MVEIMKSIMEPAILIALISVIIHGIKAFIDLIFSIKNRKIDKIQTEINYITTLLSFIDNVPLAAGKKTQLKWEILKNNIPGKIPPNIISALEKC